MQLMKQDKKTFITLMILFFIISVLFLSNNKGFDIAFFVSRINSMSEHIQRYGLFSALTSKINFSENNPYGYSINHFYGTLSLIPAAMLSVIGIEPLISYKIMIVCGVSFTWIATYYCMRTVFNKQDISLLLILSFIYAMMVPNLGDFLLAKTIKPALGFCFPIGMYNLYQLFHKKENLFGNMIGLTAAVAINLLNHNLTTITLCIVLLAEYVVLAILHKNKQELCRITGQILISAVLCIGLCSFFVFPMLEQSLLGIFVFNHGQVNINGAGNLANLWSGVIFNRAFAQMINVPQPAENNGGYLFYFLVLMWLAIKNRDKKYAMICLSVILLMLGLSIVQLPSMFSVFQFRSRLYAVFNPALILLILWGCTHNSQSTQKRISIFLIVGVIVNLLFVLILQGSIGLPDYSDKIDVGGGDYYVYNEDYRGDSTVGGYYWKYDQSIQRENIENTISELPYDWEYLESGIRFTATSDNSIVLPLTYYKGYTVFTEINDSELMKYCDIDMYTKDGLMVIDNTNQELTNRVVYVLYTGTIVQKLSIYCSLFTSVILLVVLFRKYHQRKF